MALQLKRRPGPACGAQLDRGTLEAQGIGGAIESALERTMPEPSFIPVSALTGEGIDRWIEWLEARRPAAAVASVEGAAELSA